MLTSRLPLGLLLLTLLATPRAAAAEDATASHYTIEEVLPWIRALAGRPFGELFREEQARLNRASKGGTGLMLERLLGLPANSRLRDFADAELKTNKSAPDGRPLETMFITQIDRHIDDLLNHQPFETSWVDRKTLRIISVPVVKEGPPTDWYFLPAHDISTAPGSPYFEQLKADYESICNALEQSIRDTGRIHTAGGVYLQVRTKDAKPYAPIYSRMLGREVSDKNYAFYFRRTFMEAVRKAAK